MIQARLPAGSIGVIGQASQLKHRIERLLGREIAETRPSLLAISTTTAAVLVTAALLAPGVPLAQAADTPARTAAVNGSTARIARANVSATAARAMGIVLVEAAQKGDTREAQDLIESGADVNVPVQGDGTALINAAREGHLEVVDYLVTRGADVNLAVPARNGIAVEMRSPIGEARKHGHRAVMERLQALGARE